MFRILLVFLLLSLGGTAFAQSSLMYDEDEDSLDSPLPPALPPKVSTSVKPVAPKPMAKPRVTRYEDDDEPLPPALPPRPAPVKVKPSLQDDGPLPPALPEGRTCVNCGNVKRVPPSQTRISDYRRVTSNATNMNAPIWIPFAKAFAQCAPGCQPVGVGVHRHPHEGSGRSCHYSGRAIDVHGMECDGRIYQAIDEKYRRGRFSKMVDCMDEVMDKEPIYQQARKLRATGSNRLAHYDHAHFTIGCYGGTFR